MNYSIMHTEIHNTDNHERVCLEKSGNQYKVILNNDCGDFCCRTYDEIEEATSTYCAIVSAYAQGLYSFKNKAKIFRNIFVA